MSDIKNEVSKKTLSKKDVIKSWLRWFFFAQSNYNYERLQSTAFSHSMLPVLKKLYPDKEELKQEVETHLAFFNTEPICGCVIHGITIAMEEEKANGADEISGDGMNAIKTGLMGPLAGIGDTLTQGVITPIVLAVCIGLTEGGASIAGPIGTLVMGGLVGRFINLSTPISYTSGDFKFSLQTDLLDKIFPGLIPLVLTLLVLFALKKGLSPIKIMFILIVVGAITGILGLF